MSNLMLRAYARVTAALWSEDGQAVTEYAVVLVLIAAIALVLTQSTLASTIVGKITTEIDKI